MTVLVIAGAGILAGSGAPTFLAAAAGAVFAAWRVHLHHRPKHHVFVNLDPDAPDSTLLLHAIREAVSYLCNRNHTVLLRMSAFSASKHHGSRLELSRDGDLVIACTGQRTQALKQPGLWIAEHPLPLPLPRAQCLTLLLTPTAGGRVRVSRPTALAFSSRTWAAIVAIILLVCALDAPVPLAALLGFALQTYLLQHNTHCAKDEP